MRSTIATALCQIFTGVPDLIVLDYNEAFQLLWLDALRGNGVEIQGRHLDWNSSKTSVLIVGTRPPADLVNEAPEFLKQMQIRFSAHFTAWSWAAAWRVSHTTSPAKIVLLDFTSQDSPLDSLGALFRSRDGEGGLLIPGVTLLINPGLATIVKCLDHMAKSESAQISARSAVTLLQNVVWDRLISLGELHHAISNVLGALLLTREAGPSQISGAEPIVQEYIHALVQAMQGQITSPIPSITVETAQPWLDSPERQMVPGAVLIDDMAQLWSPFLAKALGLVGLQNELFVCSPHAAFNECLQAMPSRLSDFLKSGRESLDASDLIPGRHRLSSDFVLFLDLRLFQNESKGHKTFLKALASFGIELLSSGRKLPWLDQAGKALLRDELTNLMAEAKLPGSKDTLLPRLLSLLDPTLPLVIFSSTHSSELSDPFRNFSNIVVCFRKPILRQMHTNWPAEVKELKSAFRRAMEEAARILKVRRGLIRMRSCCSANLPGSGANEVSQAIEIFTDESHLKEDKVYAIGAVVLLAQSPEKIRAFISKLETERIMWGLSCDNRKTFVAERPLVTEEEDNRVVCHRTWSVLDSSLPKIYLPKTGKEFPEFAQRKRDVAKQIEQAAKDNQVIIVAATIGCKIDDQTEEHLRIRRLAGISLSETDELHRELTSRLLQLLFLCCPPINGALNKSGTSIALDVGERHASDLENYGYQCETVFQNFGIRYTDQHLTELTPEARAMAKNRWPGSRVWDPSRKMHSVSSVTGMAFLRDGLSFTNFSSNPVICRARGVPLFYFEKTDDWRIKLDSFPCFPYQIHYLADWIAQAGAIKVADSNANSLDPFATFFDRGFVAEWNPEHRSLLLATANLESGDSVGGLEQMLIWVDRYKANLMTAQKIAKLMLKRGSESSQALEGPQLRRLFMQANARA